MGVAFSSLWSGLFGSKELKICILGLDNAGKTTLMYKMTLGSVVSTAPTVGSNTETFEYKNLKFMLWDVGGQTSLRTSWSSYLTATDAVIFVLDSNDRARVDLAKHELHRIADDESIANAPILVWANKQDIKGSLSPAEISQALALTAFRDRTWQIFGCSALTGKGLTEGLDWLAHTLGAKGFSYEALISSALGESDTPATSTSTGTPSAEPPSLAALSLDASSSNTAADAAGSNDKTNEDKAGSADEPPKAHERQAYDAEVEAQLSAVLATNRRTATPFVVDKTTREASRNWDRFYKLHADRFFKDRHWTSREFGSQIGGSSAGDPASPPASATASTASTTAAGAKRGGEDDREEEARFVAGREAGESGDGDGDGDGDGEEKVLLEVGCGVGNMLFPLLEADPKLKVHCCDFSQRAIEIVKAHPNYDAARVNAFVYDLTSSDPPLSSFLSTPQTAGWKPITTISMIFVLSAIPPQLHASTLTSMVTLLRHQLSLLGPTLPDGTPTRGHLILRDYAHGDLSQVRYHTKKDAGWAEPSLLDAQRPWYKRGDNTFNYFFTRDELDALARQVGITGEVESIYRTAVNRKRAEGRQRRFVQAKWTVEP